jgi:NAD(P)-dependent dehydrogenase (short-subunit alcohol dehydrogenase family)
MKRLLQFVSMLACSGVLLAMAQPAVAADDKAVLITGASTGIGRHLAESLAGKGYHVYAGARKDEDLAELDAIDNITAVRLDVTKQDQIDAAVGLVKKSGTGLYALVNNAGVGGGGPVLETPVEEQNFVYSVNVEGVYRTTQAFAPLVVESKGRIVTTGSVAGTKSWPGCSAYCGSKHWIEAFTDSLAAEMEPLGVQVSVVEPGNYKSNIRRTSAKRRMERQRGADGTVSNEAEEAVASATERELSLKEPEEVTEAFEHALFAEAPLLRYVVVPNADEHNWAIHTALDELIQLNQWGPYTYSREELIALLEERMAEGVADE